MRLSLEAAKPKNLTYIVEFDSCKASRPKHKKSKIGVVARQVKKGLETFQRSKRVKRGKNKSKLECFNCRKKYHFTYDYIGPKKIH